MPGIAHEQLNPKVVEAEYAVRGAITNRAAEIEAELGEGKGNYEFDKVLYCNLGNPQSLNQKPISYPRQLLACCEYPELAKEHPELFPKDVVEKAKKLSATLKPGAYTTSVGHQSAREAVAEGITNRDGHEADPNMIFLSNGASSSVHTLMELLITDEKDAFLVPIPQYPLYSAALTLHGGTMLPYYLDESKNWAVSIDEVKRVIAQAKERGLRIRGMVVINPGNPTGQCLDTANQKELLDVCVPEGIPILADEVYQENVWAEGKSFTSFRKVALDEKMNATVFSMHSISKGFMGECGHRGGYLEILNGPEELVKQLKKLMSISLCSNTVGQLMVAAMMSPPKEGEESYKQYKEEKDAILASLKRRATKLCDGLNKMDGITCCQSEGALYCFPQLHLPDAAHKAAEEAGKGPDMFYCMELLEGTGIVCVPGSGFKQKEGTFHMRLTILPPEEDMDSVIERLGAFHKKFMDKYADK